MNPSDFLGIMLIVLMLVGAVLARRSEKNKWNGGVCAECGTQWNQFDTDSQGGRMYKCKCKASHHCDISYRVDNEQTK